MSQIKNIGQTKPIYPESSGMFSIKPRHGKLLFQKGEIISVLVERVISSEKALVNIAGQKVVASTSASLNEGDTMKVFVEQQKPLLLLRPLKEPFVGALISSIRKAPPWEIDVGKLFFKILSEAGLKKSSDLLLTLKNSILEESVLSGGGLHGATRLEELIRNSGIFLENRLGGGWEPNPLNSDIKAALLKAEKLVQSMDDADRKRALPVLKALLSSVESVQNLNSLNRERGESILVNIPFHFQGELRSLKIFVNKKRGGDKEESKDGFQISLMLELSVLKKIRADIIMKKGDIFVTLYVGNDQLKGAVQAGFDLLLEKLGKLGYCGHADCFVSSENYIDGENPGKEFISDAHQTLNFTI